MLLHDLIGDMRHGARQLRLRPGFSALVLAALGLGIGASVAMLTVVQSLVIRPLPYRAESRIHVFWMDYSWTGEEYDHLRDRVQVFDRLAAFSNNGAPYSPTVGGAATTVLSYVVSSPTLFDVLDVRPALGRAFDASDDRPGAPPVIVISDAMWRADLGQDPNVIGRRILLDGLPVTVIGVMPRGFFFPTPDLRAWTPLQLDPSAPLYKAGWLSLVARARRGATASQVKGEVLRLATVLSGRFTYPAAWDKTKNPSSVPVHQYVLGNSGRPLLLLLAAVGVLFLIACANAASLIVARTSDRTGELGLRFALGAGARRLARQILAESLVLAVSSAIVGSAMALAGFRFLVARLPLADGLDSTASVGWPTLVSAFALALFIALVVSLAPVAALIRRGPEGVSRARSQVGLGRGAHGLHRILVSSQVSLAVLLVIGATLLIRSVSRLSAIDPGFQPHGAMTLTLEAPTNMPDGTRAQFLRDAAARAAALPGATAAGLTNRLPLRDQGYQGTVEIEGRPDLEGSERPNALYRTASPGLFAALGIRMVAGRGIEAQDAQGAEPVVVINESFARRMWPAGAIGRHITERWDGTPISRRVVGVAKDAQMTSMTHETPFTTWIPFEQQSAHSRQNAKLVVRSSAPAAQVVSAARIALNQLNPLVAVTRAETMDDVVSAALAEPLRLRFFLGAFAVLALGLAAIGVYGVVSYAVARRRPEFALRMALGASPSVVLTEVLRFGLTPVVTGALIGTGTAFVLAPLLQTFLYGTAPTDVASFGVASVILLAAGVAAALVPAVRAGRTNPAEALRAG